MKKALRMVLAICIVSCSSMAAAQTPPSPEQVCAQYLNAVKNKGIAAGAAFLHPDALAHFKKMMLATLSAQKPEQRDYMLRYLFGAKATIKTVQAMPPQAFMQRYLRAATSSSQLGKPLRFNILGTVPEKNLVHVLVRIYTQNKQAVRTKIIPITLKPYQDTWRLISPEGLGLPIPQHTQPAVKNKG